MHRKSLRIGVAIFTAAAVLSMLARPDPIGDCKVDDSGVGLCSARQRSPAGNSYTLNTTSSCSRLISSTWLIGSPASAK
jgi:hypothetical protein